MMNAEARRLGALQTHAVTPSGLDGPGQFTSAYDLVLIARAAFALPDFRKYVATRTAKVPPQPPKDTRGFQIQNGNGLLQKYPGALGGKSGFTTLARHSFVGAAKRGDRTLVAAVLGAEARPIRASEQTGKLLDWGFAQPAGASVGRLVEPGELALEPTPAPDNQAAAAEGAAARPADGIPGSSSAAVIGLAVAVVAIVLVMLMAVGRRRAVVRARRAALAKRRADAGRGPAGAGAARDGGGRYPPPAGRRGARGRGTPDGHNPPPAGPRDDRFPPPAAGRGATTGRPRPGERYAQPERRPPSQRRPPGDQTGVGSPPHDARYAPPGGGRYVPGDAAGGRSARGDRRPRRGPAAPDPRRGPDPDDRWS
jgi:hypothetical protein